MKVVDTNAETLPVPVVQGGPARRSLDDGLTLSISAALGSLAGLIGWAAAANIMPQSEVGRASAVVSAFILVAGCAQLNLSIGVLLWLPTSGRRAGRLVWRSLFFIMPLAALLGLVYALFAPVLVRTAAGPDGPFAIGVLFFVLATAGWGVFIVHDTILVAIGKPWWAVWRNGLFAVVRIALLVVLGLAGLGAEGIVASWVVPIVMWVVAGSFAIAVLVRRYARDAVGGALPDRRTVVRFLAPTTIAQVGTALMYNQVTVLVNLRLGTETQAQELAAEFFIVWQAVLVVDIAATYFMSSLSVNLAREPERAGELAARIRRQLLMIFLPLLAIGMLLAEPVLTLVFGAVYADAAIVLRLLLVGLAFRLVIVYRLGVLQAGGRSMAYARLQLVSTVLVLLVAVLTPVHVTAGGADEALLPIAIGYVTIQVVCAVAVLISPMRRRDKLEVRP